MEIISEDELAIARAIVAMFEERYCPSVMRVRLDEAWGIAIVEIRGRSAWIPIRLLLEYARMANLKTLRRNAKDKLVS